MFLIGKMARLGQTSVQTLRLYDRLNLLRAAHRDIDSGYRYYTADQLFRLKLIKYLQETGLSLQEIKQVMDQPDLLSDFWEKQEQVIRRNIQREKERLQMAQFQKRQFEIVKLLEQKVGSGVYYRHVNQLIFQQPIKNIITPVDKPDQEMTMLDRQLLALGQVPNLEYGFIFTADNYSKLRDIHYQFQFKTLMNNVDGAIKQDGYYACIAFRWSRAEYLSYYRQLLDMHRGKGSESPIVIEESYPQDYRRLNDGTNFITELRIQVG